MWPSVERLAGQLTTMHAAAFKMAQVEPQTDTWLVKRFCTQASKHQQHYYTTEKLQTSDVFWRTRCRMHTNCAKLRISQPMPWRRPNIIKVWPGTIREQRRRPASVPIREHLYNSPPLSSSRVQVGGGGYTFANLSSYLARTAILGQCLPHIAPVFRLYVTLSISISKLHSSRMLG